MPYFGIKITVDSGYGGCHIIKLDEKPSNLLKSRFIGYKIILDNRKIFLN